MNLFLLLFSVEHVTPDKPTLLVSPSSNFVLAASNVILTCTSGYTENVSFKFLKNSQVINSGNNELNIQSVATSDSGTYSCVVTINGVDSLPSEPPHTITVIGKSLTYFNA